MSKLNLNISPSERLRIKDLHESFTPISERRVIKEEENMVLQTLMKR